MLTERRLLKVVHVRRGGQLGRDGEECMQGRLDFGQARGVIHPAEKGVAEAEIRRKIKNEFPETQHGRLPLEVLSGQFQEPHRRFCEDVRPRL